MMCLDMDLLMLILVGVCSVLESVCLCLFFCQIWAVPSHFFLCIYIYFLILHSFSSPCGTKMIEMLHLLLLFHRYLRLCSFWFLVYFFFPFVQID